MEKRDLLICECCLEDTPILHIIRHKLIHLDICPVCHEELKKNYSVLGANK